MAIVATARATSSGSPQHAIGDIPSAIMASSRSAEVRVMSVRMIAGLVMAMILALMSLSCARRRANQSATGILYVVVVFVLIGETISLYLTLRERGTPI